MNLNSKTYFKSIEHNLCTYDKKKPLFQRYLPSDDNKNKKKNDEKEISNDKSLLNLEDSLISLKD